MNLKRRLLEGSCLYAVIDKKTLKKKSLIDATGIIKDAGTNIIQLRDKVSARADVLKSAFGLRSLLSGSKMLFIVNDYLDVAKIADSDGIHLGQGDIPVKIARKILGKEKIIGVSCHSLKQAKDAQNAGADYISIGPIFATPTKPEYKPVGLSLLKKARDKIRIPFFAIGGINEDNLDQVFSSGARRVAACRAAGQLNNKLKK